MAIPVYNSNLGIGSHINVNMSNLSIYNHLVNKQNNKIPHVNNIPN